MVDVGLRASLLETEAGARVVKACYFGGLKHSFPGQQLQSSP